MKYENTSKRFLIAIVISLGILASNVGVTGLPPTTLSGLYDSVKTTVFNFIVPNKQATKTSTGTLIETGNKNILANGSFEHTTPTTSWTVTGVSASTETGYVIDGKQALGFGLSSQAFTLCQHSTLYATEFADGVQGLASARVKTNVPNGIFVCPAKAGSAQYDQCATVSSDLKWNLAKIPFVMGGTSNGICVVSGSISSGVVTPGSVSGDTFIDSAYVGADAGIADVSVVTPWRTETITGSWTSNTTYSAKSRQVGGNLELQVSVTTSGAPTSTSLSINMPTGYTIDTSKMEFGANTVALMGVGVARDAGSASYEIAGYYLSTSAIQVRSKDSSTTALQVNNAVTQASPFTWGASDALQITISVPVVELAGSAQVFASNCGANCEDVFTARIGSGASIVSQTPSGWIASASGTTTKTLTFASGLVTDTPVCVASANTASYRFATISAQSASSVSVQVYRGDSLITVDEGFTINCRKTNADYVSTRAILGSFIARPSARAHASATSLSGSLATVVWTTEDYDTHSALSSGVFTCPQTGKYQVNSGLAVSGTFALNTTDTIEIQLNGVAYSTVTKYSGGIVTNETIQISDLVACNAGDTIRIQASSSATAPAIVSSNTKNFISIAKVGLE